MKQYILYILLPIFFFMEATAQFGGDKTYNFVNTANSAKIASLGNNTISLKNNDVSFFAQNPALIDSLYDREISMTWGNYFFLDAGIFSGSLFGSFNVKGQQIATGIKVLNYGPFRAKDEANNDLGLELATDQVLYVGWAYQFMEKYTIGANIKPIYSHIAGYNSLGILFDIGATITDTAKLLTYSAVIKNIGSQIKPYTANNYEPMPFEILIGATKKLAHAPFRVSLTYRNIQRFNLLYPEKKDEILILNTSEQPKDKDWQIFGDKLLRHVIVGGEFLLSKNIYAAVSYDHRKRKELTIESRKGGVGFSYGLGIKISKFRFEYGHTNYNLAGGTNLITINANLNDFTKHP